jgi:hypothetical protein
LEAGGLPRTDYPGFADEFRQLVDANEAEPITQDAEKDE